MNRTTIALEMIHELSRLSRSLRMNEVHVTATYARLAENSRLGFGGITSTDALVLDVLGDNSHANGQFVADQIGMTKGGMSKVLAKLQEKKLVLGKKDESDYKSTFYTLTTLGRKARTIHKKMLSVASTEIHDLIADLSDEEIACIRNFVSGMTERLGAISKHLEKIDG